MNFLDFLNRCIFNNNDSTIPYTCIPESPIQTKQPDWSQTPEIRAMEVIQLLGTIKKIQEKGSNESDVQANYFNTRTEEGDFFEEDIIKILLRETELPEIKKIECSLHEELEAQVVPASMKIYAYINCDLQETLEIERAKRIESERSLKEKQELLKTLQQEIQRREKELEIQQDLQSDLENSFNVQLVDPDSTTLHNNGRFSFKIRDSSEETCRKSRRSLGELASSYESFRKNRLNSLALLRSVSPSVLALSSGLTIVSSDVFKILKVVLKEERRILGKMKDDATACLENSTHVLALSSQQDSITWTPEFEVIARRAVFDVDLLSLMQRAINRSIIFGSHGPVKLHRISELKEPTDLDVANIFTSLAKELGEELEEFSRLKEGFIQVEIQ